MAQENLNLAILFADIANSTKIYESLGNQTALDLIDDCLSLLAKVAVRYKGTVVKTIGDEIMCTFPSAAQAVDAAMDMNRDLMDMPIDAKLGAFPPNIYVGLQFGPVIREDNDVFGDAVNVASHMVKLAKPRQIVTTEETVAALTDEQKNAARHIDKTTIKSKAGEVDIYEIMWEQKDETIMLNADLNSLVEETRMELHHGGKTLEVGQNRPIVTLGRQNHNDLILNEIRISRTHARIEYRRGKFLLIDQSTNGTYALPKGGDIIKLKRDECPLTGTGVISLGREIDPSSTGSANLIYYEITT